MVVKIGGGGGGGGGMGGEGEMRQEAMNTSTQWASCRDIDNSFIWYMVAIHEVCRATGWCMRICINHFNILRYACRRLINILNL